MILRSLLFVPAHKEHLIKKALKTKADAIIFDLEDGCPGEENKKIGIENIKKYYRENDIVRIEIFKISILREIEEIYDFINIVMIPKYSGLDGTPTKNLKVIPLIETCFGIQNLLQWQIINDNIIALAFGELDYKMDNYCLDTNYAKQIIINSAHAFGIPAIATPNLDLSNENRLRVKIREDQEKGFDGTMTIHPKEIEMINQAYTPDMEYANNFLKIYKTTDEGVNFVDKKLYAPPIYRKCLKQIEYYEEIQRMESQRSNKSQIDKK